MLWCEQRYALGRETEPAQQWELFLNQVYRSIDLAKVPWSAPLNCSGLGWSEVLGGSAKAHLKAAGEEKRVWSRHLKREPGGHRVLQFFLSEKASSNGQYSRR